MPTDRQRLAVNLDEDTYDRLRAFCRDRGLDMSSLVEAFGRAVPDLSERLPKWLAVLVSEAAAIREDRKDRRPTD